MAHHQHPAPGVPLAPRGGRRPGTGAAPRAGPPAHAGTGPPTPDPAAENDSCEGVARACAVGLGVC